MIVTPPEETDRQRPRCYNRAPHVVGRWEYGINRDTGELERVWIGNDWFVDRCVTHDGVGIGPNNENYPTAHGFDCRGCRWNPTENKS